MTEQRQQPDPQKRLGALRIGRVVGVPVFVSWSWLIIAVLIGYAFEPTIAGQIPDLGAWAYVAALGFAVMLYASVLLHEIAHVLVARAYKLPVRAITLQLLGGISEIEKEPGTPWREFTVAVVGPLTSLAVSGGSFALWQWVAMPDLLSLLVYLLAVANLVVGLLNLLPGLPLDGGRILRAIVWAISKQPHLATAVAAWAGRGVAVMVAVLPFVVPDLVGSSLLSIMWALLIAAFLWAGSTQALIASRIRRKLPSLAARALARRGVPVTADVSLAEAIRRAQDIEAGALVVVENDGTPSGLVSEAAVLATPEHRRPWLPIGDLARRLEPGLVLSANLIGEELVRAMGGTPATEYLLIEDDGSVFGVLTTSDVDTAFSRA